MFIHINTITYIHVHMHAHIQICMHAYTHIHTHKHTYIHIHLHVHRCKHNYIYICTHACTHIDMHACIHIHAPNKRKGVREKVSVSHVRWFQLQPCCDFGVAEKFSIDIKFVNGECGLSSFLPLEFQYWK